MTMLSRLFAPTPPPPLVELNARVIEVARRPEWYLQGQVPDTLDGRFDVLALVTSLVLMRLEREGRNADAVALTERFIHDMDGQLREMGVGDMSVGRQVGYTVSALGGRLGAYREAFAGDIAAALPPALARNLYRGAPPHDAAVGWVAGEAARVKARIDSAPIDALLAGRPFA